MKKWVESVCYEAFTLHELVVDGEAWLVGQEWLGRKAGKNFKASIHPSINQSIIYQEETHAGGERTCKLYSAMLKRKLNK